MQSIKVLRQPRQQRFIDGARGFPLSLLMQSQGLINGGSERGVLHASRRIRDPSKATVVEGIGKIWPMPMCAAVDGNGKIMPPQHIPKTATTAPSLGQGGAESEIVSFQRHAPSIDMAAALLSHQANGHTFPMAWLLLLRVIFIYATHLSCVHFSCH
jgi:hypothetical protein